MKPILYLVDDDDSTNIYNEIILSEVKEIEAFKIFDNVEIALDALEKVERKPDFLFLDINMPKISGWDVVVEIQKSPDKYLNAPFRIYMLSTSLSEFDLKEEAKHPLVTKMIEKPLTEELLNELLHNKEIHHNNSID